MKVVIAHKWRVSLIKKFNFIDIIHNGSIYVIFFIIEYKHHLRPANCIKIYVTHSIVCWNFYSIMEFYIHHAFMIAKKVYKDQRKISHWDEKTPEMHNALLICWMMESRHSLMLLHCISWWMKNCYERLLVVPRVSLKVAYVVRILWCFDGIYTNIVNVNGF